MTEMSILSCTGCDMYAVEDAKHVGMQCLDIQDIKESIFDDRFGVVHYMRERS